MKKSVAAISILLLFAGQVLVAQDYEDEEYAEVSDSFVRIYGEAGAEGKAWVDTDEIKSASKGSGLDADKKAFLKLDFEYSGTNSEVTSSLKFDSSTINEYPQDILNEFSLKGYFLDDSLTLEAGKEKIVWGKTDNYHVIDNFNANDFSEYLIPDYENRRLAEPMFRAVIAPHINSGNFNHLKIEGVWTPLMTADRYASSGQWLTASNAELNELIEGLLQYNLSKTVANETSEGLPGSIKIVDKIMSTSSFTSSQLYSENISTIRYGQAGARITYSLFGIDMGFSYYYGHYKTPTLNLSPLNNSVAGAIQEYVNSTEGQTKIATDFATEISEIKSDMNTIYNNAITEGKTETISPVTGDIVDLEDPAAIAAAEEKDAMTKICADHSSEIFLMSGKDYELPSLDFDQLQTFGFESAFIIPGLNLNTKLEAAYNLTKDTAGDNPYIKNNSIAWSAGIDRFLPLHHIYFNVQTQGTFILKNKNITDETDTDYNSDGKYITNRIMFTLSDSSENEKFTASVKGIYIVETKGMMFMPEIDVKCAENLSLYLNGAYIKSDNKNCELYQYTYNTKDNWKAFVSLGGKYQF